MKPNKLRIAVLDRLVSQGRAQCLEILFQAGLCPELCYSLSHKNLIHLIRDELHATLLILCKYCPGLIRSRPRPFEECMTDSTYKGRARGIKKILEEWYNMV